VRIIHGVSSDSAAARIGGRAAADAFEANAALSRSPGSTGNNDLGTALPSDQPFCMVGKNTRHLISAGLIAFCCYLGDVSGLTDHSPWNLASEGANERGLDGATSGAFRVTGANGKPTPPLPVHSARLQALESDRSRKPYLAGPGAARA